MRLQKYYKYLTYARKSAKNLHICEFLCTFAVDFEVMANINKRQVPENNIILYQDENGITRVNVRFSHEDVWLNQEQMAEIYCTTQQNVSLHIRNIYTDGELSEESTHKKFLLVRQEGNRKVNREMDHYNLDVIIDDTLYHCGHSVKDLGKKWFGFVKLEQTTDELLSKM